MTGDPPEERWVWITLGAGPPDEANGLGYGYGNGFHPCRRRNQDQGSDIVTVTETATVFGRWGRGGDPSSIQTRNDIVPPVAQFEVSSQLMLRSPRPSQRSEVSRRSRCLGVSAGVPVGAGPDR